ncbi:hypothetical protein [Planotetraspora sp. GP83]|uniref:hypothetical protein n=1 Tax=Planotetraspora sp. GP83 TaxID=3156264 RepID=UPI003512232B
MIMQRGERYFTTADAGALYGPGVVTSGMGRRRVWYEEHDPQAAVRMALAVARRSWVDAVAVLPLGATLAQGGLALAFGEHLHEVRRRRHLAGACITSPMPPPLPRPRLCRVPHLVTVEGADGTWRDTAVWEVMTAERFQAWVGREPAGLGALEKLLPRLLRLRRSAREDTLPDTLPGRELRELLRTRYLSTLLVLEHPDLFNSLLAPPQEARL